MSVRRSDRALIVLLILVIGFVLTFADAAHLRQARTPALAERQRLVRTLALTDLCLFSEARYTRHPSQADLHSAFQDHPFALEHFPTGSIVPPPASLMDFLGATREAAGDTLHSGNEGAKARP